MTSEKLTGHSSMVRNGMLENLLVPLLVDVIYVSSSKGESIKLSKRGETQYTSISTNLGG